VTFNSGSSYKVDANSTSAKVDKVVAKGVTINALVSDDLAVLHAQFTKHNLLGLVVQNVESDRYGKQDAAKATTFSGSPSVIDASKPINFCF